MQSTGQTSTQAVSFVSIQGSVMMNGMLASLRNVRDVCSVRQFQFLEPDPIGRPSGPEPGNYTASLHRGNRRPPTAGGRMGRSARLSDIRLPQGAKHHRGWRDL